MQETSASKSAALLRYRDPKGAIDWLCAAFGLETRFTATRADGSFAYAHLALSDQQITVTARDERSLEPSEAVPGVGARATKDPKLIVADITAHFRRAKAAGAEIVRAIDVGEDGTRSYVCRDIEGNTWAFRKPKTQRSVDGLAWVRARLPRMEKLSSQRTGLAAAAVLTLVALAVPALRFYAVPEAPAARVMPQRADIPAKKPRPPVNAGQALEHARFALVEEQAARLVAEDSRRAALAELAQERTARLEAENEARRVEAELAAARAAAATAEVPVNDLDEETGWETQIARDAVPPAQDPSQIIPVSVAQPTDATPVAAAPPKAPPPSDPVLAKGQAALAKGDVEEARRIFRRLADEGIAEAALALGSTYDPVNVAQKGLAPGQADRAQAKQWYRRAIELTQAATERHSVP